MKNLIAVIPVRVGSQRVKNKNFKPFAGKTLLEHKLDIVKQLPVDEIIINTDSELAVEMAIRHGVSYHIREPYYASSECSGSEFHEYLAKVTKSENILVAHVTEPLVSKETFIDGIKTYYNNDCDCLVSVEVVKKFLWYKGKPLNYNPEKAPASQDLPEYLSPTFGVVVAKRESILHSKHLICSKPYFYKINEIEAGALFSQNPEFILGLGRPENRSILTDKLINCGGKLVSLIAPTALVGTYDVYLGEGLNIMHASMISNSVHVGKGTLINAFVSVHHDVTIGDYCEIAPHAVILGGCTIGDYTSIGSNATVMPNVSVGNRVTVGAGALVNKDLPDDCTAFGVPARIIRQK